jgi:glycosyltransferase involved in cell wall biosynthesis
MLSIVSATLNSEERIGRFIESLKLQTSKEFTWYVVDGGSEDRTVELIQELDFSRVRVVKRSSLYEALNAAIEMSDSEYYLVAGDDDILASDAVSIANKIISESDSNADIINFNCKIDDQVRRPKGGWLVWRGVQVFAPAHAVGMLISKKLHLRQDIGYYDARYTIAADQDFLIKSYITGVSQYYSDNILGTFSRGGVSSKKRLETLRQWTSIQIKYFPKYRLVLYLRFVVVFLKWKCRL